ncbi:class I SAM-dependent methyltransferase [Actinomadura adrarensis]|uniref:Class I SAM-dependent methyltransferase n=1 Tax=Actinomadura adrarensis TaxID=1819600 RepID=A0ABW3CTR2_9ACTN
MVPGTVGYAEDADALVRRYERLEFSEVHSDVLHLFPERPGRVLDVGAGSGRDAAALATAGHDVVAVEPTAEMRMRAQRLHPSERITWVNDALPDLQRLSETPPFDAILLSAVWMHLDEQERPSAMKRLTTMLAPGGGIVLTLRHGPMSPRHRMFDVSAEETINLAEQAGLTLLHHNREEDLLGRSTVSWSCLGFGWANAGA